MKNLKNLGKVLSTKEQKNVNGGRPKQQQISQLCTTRPLGMHCPAGTHIGICIYGAVYGYGCYPN